MVEALAKAPAGALVLVHGAWQGAGALEGGHVPQLARPARLTALLAPVLDAFAAGRNPCNPLAISSMPIDSGKAPS